MENKIEYDSDGNGIKAKVETVNNVKEKFYQMVKKKIGELLVEEISRVTGEAGIQAESLKFLKLPHFLKPIFSFYNDDQLLIETSLLYIMYSLDLMNAEMQIEYQKKIAKVEEKKEFLLTIKDLLRVNCTKDPEFVCKFYFPPYILTKFAGLEDQFPNLVAFGVIKIFEWLKVLEFGSNLEYKTYERSFAEVFQKFSRTI